VKLPLGRPGHSWKGGTREPLKEKAYKGVVWAELALGRILYAGL